MVEKCTLDRLNKIIYIAFQNMSKHRNAGGVIINKFMELEYSNQKIKHDIMYSRYEALVNDITSLNSTTSSMKHFHDSNVDIEVKNKILNISRKVIDIKKVYQSRIDDQLSNLHQYAKDRGFVLTIIQKKDHIYVDNIKKL